MSGHSHWASIKHKKAATDAKRGQLFSKLARAITVAAREGGGDPSQLHARCAIEKARGYSMPKDNIQRAIKRGTGELDGGNLEEVIYEGYGPGGVAILCEVLTDNRNRTAAEIRKVFELPTASWAARLRRLDVREQGAILVVDARYSEDDLIAAIDAGADDVIGDGDMLKVLQRPRQPCGRARSAGKRAWRSSRPTSRWSRRPSSRSGPTPARP